MMVVMVMMEVLLMEGVEVMGEMVWEVMMLVLSRVEHFCARHGAKRFIYTISFYSHSNPMHLGIFCIFRLLDEEAEVWRS